MSRIPGLRPRGALWAFPFFLGALPLSVAAQTPTDTPARPVQPPVLEAPIVGAESIELRFAARVGDAPFQCGESYTGGALGSATVEGRDLRLFVSEVTFLMRDGSEAALELEQDGLWQHRNLALLDFEDGTGECRNGTAPTRDRVTGTLPSGEIQGIRFTLGVPFELNHQNQALAPSPLSLTALFWSWNGGYKFLRAEVLSDGLPQGFFVHLGSTRCSPEGSPSRPATACEDSNRVTVEFPEFDPSRQRIVFDLAALLSGSELSRVEGGERAACMSAPTDARCAPVFRALGLPFGGSPAGAQQIFRVEDVR
jgi:uncharacterized repeat protein (TIGR04052 family)